MAREKLIINGYNVPGGFGGAAVRRACELIHERPGITQRLLLREVVKFSELNESNAKWIVSETNGPVGFLWKRSNKYPDIIGVRGFSCHPNDFTEKLVGTAIDAWKKAWYQEVYSSSKRIFNVNVGDLVRFEPDLGLTSRNWSRTRRLVFRSQARLAPPCPPEMGILINFSHMGKKFDSINEVFSDVNMNASHKRHTIIANILANGTVTKNCLQYVRAA